MKHNTRRKYTKGQQKTLNNVKIKFNQDTYVNEAEQVIKEMRSKNFKIDKDVLTTSQLRKLLSLTSALYDEVRTYGIDLAMDRISYLRIQFVYQSGRNKAVKALVSLSDILTILEEIEQTQNKEKFLRFCRYMEALVAYFKYYGGKD